MAFSQELDDFASGFSKGYDMVQSKEEKEYSKARTRYMTASATELESQTTPEALARKAEQLDIQIDTARQNLLDLKDPVKREREARDAESLIKARDIVTKINELNHEIEADPTNRALTQKHKELVGKLDELNLKNAERTGKRDDLLLRQEEIKTEDAERFNRMMSPYFDALERRANPGTRPLTEAVPAEGGSPLFPNINVPGESSPSGFTYDPGSPAGPAGPAAGGGGVTFEPPAPTAVDVPLEDREQVGEVPVFRGPAEAAPAGNEQPLAYTAEEPPRERYGLSPVEMEGSDMTPAQKAIEDFLNGNLTSTKDKKGAVIDAGKEATRVGLNYQAEVNGLHQDYAVGTPEVEKQHEDFLTGAKGADPEAGQMVMDMTNQAAGGDLSIDEQATYALGIGYLWHLAHGDPEAAAKYAGSMVGFNQRMASQYAVFGQAAAANGDISAANEAIMRAYAHVTNGESLHITPTEDGRFNATITDMKTGKVRHEQIMTPDEIGAMAAGVTADSYVKLMSQAAGIPDKTISDEAAVLLGLTKGIKDPELAIKLFSNLTTAEFNSLTMSEKAANAQRDAADKTAVETREKRLLSPEAMGKVVTDIETTLLKIEESNPKAFGALTGEGQPTTYQDQEALAKEYRAQPDKSKLKIEDYLVNYRDDVKTVALDLISNPENRGEVGTDAATAIQIARSLAEKRPNDLDIIDDNTIRIYVRGFPRGLVLNRQIYNNIGLVRSYREELQKPPKTDTKQPAAAETPEVVGPPAGAVDAGPVAPAVHPRVGAGGGQAKPLPIPGGPSRSEGPSRAGMPRPPSERPRSRSDYPGATPVPVPAPAPVPPLAPSSRDRGGGSLLNDEIQQLFQ